MSPIVDSLHIGTPREMPYGEVTAFRRETVPGPIRAEDVSLLGDQVGDTKNHGGYDQALYAVATEQLAWWSDELGLDLVGGDFGENLTTAGIDLNACLIGERWRVGTVLLEVASVRIPCASFQRYIAFLGGPESGWVKRYTQHGDPGVYLRIIEPGEITSGDEIAVVTQPEHDVRVAEMFQAMTTQPALLPRLSQVEDLAVLAQQRLARQR